MKFYSDRGYRSQAIFWGAWLLSFANKAASAFGRLILSFSMSGISASGSGESFPGIEPQGKLRNCGQGRMQDLQFRQLDQRCGEAG
jgi:hypothetical protein